MMLRVRNERKFVYSFDRERVIKHFVYLMRVKVRNALKKSSQSAFVVLIKAQ